jgi:hypothetical protein
MDSQRTATHMFALRLPPDLYEATRAKAATATAALNSTFGQTARGEHMQQFAIAALAPRSIAWLISADDWAHLESLVAYNCALLGGYFNALIPLMRGGAIDAAYEHFLLAYDPDLIVLAPDMEQTALEPFLRSHPRFNPFGVVPWDALHLVAARDPRDANSPWMNAPIPLDAPVVVLDGPPSIMSWRQIRRRSPRG